MTDKIEECNCSKEMDHTDCPEDKKVDGKCPDMETKQEAESVPKWAKELQTSYTSLSGQLEKLMTKEAELGVREIPKPEAKVSNSSDEQFNMKKSLEKVQKWIESDRSGSCTIEIPVDYLRGINTVKVKTPSGVQERYRNAYATDQKVKEALGYTGTQSLADIDSDVALEPGQTSFVPVTQFAKYKEIEKGSNLARFFKHDLPSTASQTPGTVATVATMDIEAVDVTPSTITGVFLEIDTDDIENYPYDVVGTVVKASAAKFDDFIATDMLDTVSAEGTLTPLAWIKGSDGTTITHTDTASVTMDPTGIATGVQKLEDYGYLRGGAKPVCFLHPQQFKELIEDSELANYTQFANPSIVQKYQMAELYGCTLVRTNAVQEKDNTTNDAYNAIMCVPQHSYGVGSKRTVNIKFHEVPEENQIWATTNWRIKSGVIDANSIVRISTTK
jgi:hypothetical protein